jgi:O-antigen/teichoic acid export membrane protein
VTAVRSPMARLAANTVPLAASQLVSSGLLLMSLILVARVLGPQDYGLFAIGLAIFGLSAFISDAGLGMWGIRVIADDPDHWSIISRLTAARAITVVLALIVASAALAILPFPPGSTRPALVMALAVIPVGLSLEYALIGLERNGLVALIRVAVSVTILGLSPVLAVHLGAVGAAVGYLIATTVGCAASWVLFTAVAGWPHLRRPTHVLGTLRRSFPMGVNSVIGQIYKQSDSVLTGMILGASAAGIYAAPMRLLAPVSSFGWVIGASLLPIYRSLDADGDDRSSALATNTMRLLVLACIPAIGVGIGAAQTIVGALLGPAFSDSAAILSIGALGAGLSLCVSPAGYAILARRYDRRYAAATMVTAAVANPKIVILPLLTRDTRGVAVAMLLAEIASAIILLSGAQRSGLRLGRFRNVVGAATMLALVGGLAARFVPGGIVGVVLLGLLVEIPFGVSLAREVMVDRKSRVRQIVAPSAPPGSPVGKGSTSPDR